jgi:hypothetical protein
VPGGRPVDFLGHAREWADAVLALADGRWRWAAPADVVVVTHIDELPRTGALVLFVDDRPTPPPAEVVAAFRAGADGYVADADAEMVLAHLDALGRRLDRTSPGDDFTADPPEGRREPREPRRTVGP